MRPAQFRVQRRPKDPEKRDEARRQKERRHCDEEKEAACALVGRLWLCRCGGSCDGDDDDDDAARPAMDRYCATPILTATHQPMWRGTRKPLFAWHASRGLIIWLRHGWFLRFIRNVHVRYQSFYQEFIRQSSRHGVKKAIFIIILVVKSAR